MAAAYSTFLALTRSGFEVPGKHSIKLPGGQVTTVDIGYATLSPVPGSDLAFSMPVNIDQHFLAGRKEPDGTFQYAYVLTLTSSNMCVLNFYTGVHSIPDSSALQIVAPVTSLDAVRHLVGYWLGLASPPDLHGVLVRVDSVDMTPADILNLGRTRFTADLANVLRSVNHVVVEAEVIATSDLDCMRVTVTVEDARITTNVASSVPTSFEVSAALYYIEWNLNFEDDCDMPKEWFINTLKSYEHIWANPLANKFFLQGKTPLTAADKAIMLGLLKAWFPEADYPVGDDNEEFNYDGVMACVLEQLVGFRKHLAAFLDNLVITRSNGTKTFKIEGGVPITLQKVVDVRVGGKNAPATERDPRLVTFTMARDMIQRFKAWSTDTVKVIDPGSAKFQLEAHPACGERAAASHTFVVGNKTVAGLNFVAADMADAQCMIGTKVVAQVYSAAMIVSRLQPVFRLDWVRNPDGTKFVVLEMNAYPVAALQELSNMLTKNKEHTADTLQDMVTARLDSYGWPQVEGAGGIKYHAPSFLSIRSPVVRTEFATLSTALGPILHEMLFKGSKKAAEVRLGKTCWLPQGKDGWKMAAKSLKELPRMFVDLCVGKHVTLLCSAAIQSMTPDKVNHVKLYSGKIPDTGVSMPTREDVMSAPMLGIGTTTVCTPALMVALFPPDRTHAPDFPCLPPPLTTIPGEKALKMVAARLATKTFTPDPIHQRHQAHQRHQRHQRRRTEFDDGTTGQLGRVIQALAARAGIFGQFEDWINACGNKEDPVTYEDLEAHKSVAIVTNLADLPLAKLQCLSVDTLRRDIVRARRTPYKEWLEDPEVVARLCSAHPEKVFPNPDSGEGYFPDYKVKHVSENATPTYYKITQASGNTVLVDDKSLKTLGNAAPGTVLYLQPLTTIRYGNAGGDRGVSQSHGQVTDAVFAATPIGNLAAPRARGLLRDVAEFVGPLPL